MSALVGEIVDAGTGKNGQGFWDAARSGALAGFPAGIIRLATKLGLSVKATIELAALAGAIAGGVDGYSGPGINGLFSGFGIGALIGAIGGAAGCAGFSIWDDIVIGVSAGSLIGVGREAGHIVY